MKHIISLIFISLIFIGCSIKPQVVDIKNPNEQIKKELGTPINPKVEIGKEIKEDVEKLDEDDIIENEIPIVDNSETMNIAFVYPSRVIGKYAKSSMNTTLGYLSFKNIKYNIKVFDTKNENADNIQNAFSKVQDSGIKNVIALFSPRATDILHTINTSNLKVYLPLSSKEDTVSVNNNFIYGAISYSEQIIKLLEYSNTNNAMFYQNSLLGNKLKIKYETLVPNVSVVKKIDKKRNYFKGIVRDNRLKNSSLFLNTSIVKTSILLSQLRAYYIYPKAILSTQLNYNPKLFSLTQVKDRKNFIIANSIGKVDDKLEDSISTFGGDVKYNWVDYSTLVGVNYLYDGNDQSIIPTEINGNTVIYEPKLFRSTAFGFSEIK